MPHVKLFGTITLNVILVRKKKSTLKLNLNIYFFLLDLHDKRIQR